MKTCCRCLPSQCLPPAVHLSGRKSRRLTCHHSFIRTLRADVATSGWLTMVRASRDVALLLDRPRCCNCWPLRRRRDSKQYGTSSCRAAPSEGFSLSARRIHRPIQPAGLHCIAD
jgi:hypothetical protein